MMITMIFRIIIVMMMLIIMIIIMIMFKFDKTSSAYIINKIMNIAIRCSYFVFRIRILIATFSLSYVRNL